MLVKELIALLQEECDPEEEIILDQAVETVEGFINIRCDHIEVISDGKVANLFIYPGC